MVPVESPLGIIPYDQLTLRRANRLLYAVLPAFILLLINMLTKSVLCFNAQGGQYYPVIGSRSNHSCYGSGRTVRHNNRVRHEQSGVCQQSGN